MEGRGLVFGASYFLPPGPVVAKAPALGGVAVIESPAADDFDDAAGAGGICPGGFALSVSTVCTVGAGSVTVSTVAFGLQLKHRTRTNKRKRCFMVRRSEKRMQ